MTPDTCGFPSWRAPLSGASAAACCLRQPQRPLLGSREAQHRGGAAFPPPASASSGRRPGRVGYALARALTLACLYGAGPGSIFSQDDSGLRRRLDPGEDTRMLFTVGRVLAASVPPPATGSKSSDRGRDRHLGRRLLRLDRARRLPGRRLLRHAHDRHRLRRAGGLLPLRALPIVPRACCDAASCSCAEWSPSQPPRSSPSARSAIIAAASNGMGSGPWSTVSTPLRSPTSSSPRRWSSGARAASAASPRSPYRRNSSFGRHVLTTTAIPSSNYQVRHAFQALHGRRAAGPPLRDRIASTHLLRDPGGGLSRFSFRVGADVARGAALPPRRSSARCAGSWPSPCPSGWCCCRCRCNRGGCTSTGRCDASEAAMSTSYSRRSRSSRSQPAAFKAASRPELLNQDHLLTVTLGFDLDRRTC